MSVTGRNIVTGFRELRKFCQEVALLLRTADGMMLKHGWTTTKKCPAIPSASRSLESPYFWLPTEFCRFYEHDEYPRLLVYIAVNIDEPDESSPVTEALLSAGWIDYGPGKKPQGWEYWFCRWHLYTAARKDDGTLCVDEPQEYWGREEGYQELPEGVMKVTTFAYPLTDICTSEILKTTIVKPLVDGIAKEIPPAEPKQVR